MNSAAAGYARRGGIYCENSTCESLAIQAFHSRFKIPRILKLHKAEATGVAGNSVPYHLSECDGVTVLFEPALQFCFAA